MPEENFVQNTSNEKIAVTHKNKYGFTFDKTARPRPGDYFNHSKYIIQLNESTTLRIKGIGREESISMSVDKKNIADSNILSMNGSISNLEMDAYLKTKALPEITTSSILLHDKTEKTADELGDEKGFLNKALSRDNIEALRGGKPIVIPVRRGKGANPSDREGHWFNVRLSLSDGKINAAIENTIAEANLSGKKVEDIIQGYKKTIIDPIAEIIGYELGKVNYLETKQYGNMGCGITTANNIQKNRSKNPENYLQDADQDMAIVPPKDIGFGIMTDASETYSLNASGNKKSLPGNLFEEALTRADITSVKHKGSRLIKDITSIKPLNDKTKITIEKKHVENICMPKEESVASRTIGLGHP